MIIHVTLQNIGYRPLFPGPHAFSHRDARDDASALTDIANRASEGDCHYQSESESKNIRVRAHENATGVP